MTAPTPPTLSQVARQRSYLANQVAVAKQRRQHLVDDLERSQAQADASRLRLEDHDATIAALQNLIDSLGPV